MSYYKKDIRRNCTTINSLPTSLQSDIINIPKTWIKRSQAKYSMVMKTPSISYQCATFVECDTSHRFDIRHDESCRYHCARQPFLLLCCRLTKMSHRNYTINLVVIQRLWDVIQILFYTVACEKCLPFNIQLYHISNTYS